MITGKTLIAWGYAPGPWFAAAIAAAEKARLAGADEPAIRAVVEGFAPPPAPPSVGLREHGALAYRINARADDQHEAENLASVERHMPRADARSHSCGWVGDAGRRLLDHSRGGRTRCMQPPRAAWLVRDCR